MYNAHRGMGPPGPVPGTRLAELLEQVRAEFETQAGRSNQHEHERKYTIGPYWCGRLVEWRSAYARARNGRETPGTARVVVSCALLADCE